MKPYNNMSILAIFEIILSYLRLPCAALIPQKLLTSPPSDINPFKGLVLTTHLAGTGLV